MPATLDVAALQPKPAPAPVAAHPASVAAHPAAPAPDDPRDARWKQCYMAAPYDGVPMSIQDAPALSHSPLPPKFTPSTRPLWASQWAFLLSSLGLRVGLAAITGFPYLMYKHGGGAFLLPYVLFLFLVGMPLLYLELGVAQYAQLGPLHVWRCSSAFKGVGAATLLLAVYCCLFSGQLMAYSGHYLATLLGHLGATQVPWGACDPATPAGYCREFNLTAAANASSAPNPSQFHFRYNLLHQSMGNGPDASPDMGLLRWDLILCLMASWVVVALALSRGVTSLGRVVPVMTVISFVLLVLLLLNSIFLPGHDMGLLQGFAPRWEALGGMGAWVAALEHVLFSLALGVGGAGMLGSHNRFHGATPRLAVAEVLVHLLLSVLASVLVFATLGGFATQLNLPSIYSLDVDHWMTLAFLPSALHHASAASHFWSLLLFLMIFLTALTTSIGHMYTLVGSMQDSVKSLRKSSFAVSSFLCVAVFLLGLPFCTEKRGLLLLGVFQRYALGASVMAVALCQLLALSYAYGVRRLADDMALMMANPPSMFWKVCWAFVSPAIILVCLIASLANTADPFYSADSDPVWAYHLRWALPLSSVILIPIVFFVVLLKNIQSKTPERVLRPDAAWGPGDPETRARLMRGRGGHGRDNPALAL